MSSNSRLWLGAMALALSGCSGLSDVDEQPTLAPTAVAQVVGYANADDTGNVSAEVRAHTEVLLTGKESIEADKPILSFVWKAVNAADDRYITVRNSSTINVSVPSVGAARDIAYQLTVTDSDGDTDTSTATLHVQPVLDSDRFLTYVNNYGRLRLVAATPQPSPTIAFTLELSAHVTYVTRPSTENNKITSTVDYPIGDPVTGSWLASSAPGTDGGAADFRNPVFEFPLPAINLDDIIRKHQAGLPGTEGMMPDPAFTPDATIEVIAKLTPAGGRAASLIAVDNLGTPVVSASSGGAAFVELHIPNDVLENLRILGGGVENRATANSYYDAIDPLPSRKLTLKNWLAENCFDQTKPNWGADAHAVYVNNFDLGFGRDMYFRSSAPAGCTSTTFHAGDAASVVVNYATLEGAAKKVDPVIAVAMEYKASDPNRTTPGVVSFYVFAPDEGTGEFRRVTSANFDGRGEKSVPGACTVCHGGRPKATYSVGNTNVDATFMPWDLESFLFSDTDPVFPTDGANAALKAQYTRAAQEAEFKKLNLAAYSTYGSINPQQAVTCYPSHTGPCDLVKLWYGDDLASAKFLDKVVGKGWRTGFVDPDLPGSLPNPASAEQLYTDVFARNCRACHTQRVVQLKAGSDPQFKTYAQFVDTTGGAASNHDKIVKLVLHDAVMPAARLTMDRLWTRAPGATTSAGALLAEHFGQPAGTQPGRAFACATSTPSLGATSETRQTIVRRGAPTAQDLLGPKTTVSLDASCSSFVRSYQWQLTPPATSTATIVGSNTARASFQVDTHGNYDVNLHVTGLGDETSDAPLFGVVNNLLPIGRAVPSQAVDINVPTAIDVLTGSTLGDPPTVIDAVSATGAGLTATLNAATQRVDVTASNIIGGTVTYSIRDEDNDVSADVTFPVTVNASISLDTTSSASVPVNSSNRTLNLPTVAAQSQPFRIELWNGVAWVASGAVTTSLPARGGAARGSAVFNSCAGTACSVLYTPPGKTVTPPGATQDTFSYRACFLADTTRCSDTGTYTVAITASTNFNDVASILRGVCTSCHVSASGFSDRWSIAASNASDASVFQAVRCLLGQSSTANDGADAGARYVNITTPASSLLRIKPGAADNHGHDTNDGMAKIPPAELQTILSWIQEGGYFTAGGQVCSPL